MIFIILCKVINGFFKFFSKRWKIVATVKKLSGIKQGKTGDYFFVDLFDSTGEIRALAYDSEVDRLYKKLEVILFIINIIKLYTSMYIKISYCIK